MLAAFEAACCAAKGVPLRDPRKPSDPELFHDRTLPFMSVMVTIVLLKEACTYAKPWGTCLRSFFLNVFFLPFFSGVAGAPPAATGLAMNQFSVLSSQFPANPGLTENRELRTENWSLSFCRRLLLLRDRSLARTLTSAGVRMRALPANRQVAAVPKPAVRAYFDEALDVHRNFLAQIALDHSFRLDHRTDAVDLFFAEVLDLFHGVHFGLVENVAGARLPNAVDIRQRNVDVLLARKIDACNTCHKFLTSPGSWLLAFGSIAKSQERKAKGCLALALLVFRVGADHAHHALAVDDLALVANLFYRCSDFHTVLSSPSSQQNSRGL